MKNLLIQLVTNITRKPRYSPKIKWDKRIWIANIFRAWEYIAGRRYGLRPEVSSRVELIDGEFVVQYEFYTIEAVLAHIEATVRRHLALLFNLKPYPRLDFRPVQLTFGILGLYLSLKTNTAFLPLFGLAIAVDTTTNSGDKSTASDPWNWSHTSTGSDLVLACSVSSLSRHPSGVTYNSVALSANTGAQINQGSNIYSSMWHKINPSTGSNTVSVDYATTTYGAAGAITFSGADQTTQPDASAEEGGASATTNVLNITTNTADAYIVDAISIDTALTNSGPTKDAAQTQIYAFNTNPFVDSGSSYKAAGAAGAKTMTWTWTVSVSTEEYAHTALAIKPAGGGGSTRVPLRSLLGVGT